MNLLKTKNLPAKIFAKQKLRRASYQSRRAVGTPTEASGLKTTRGYTMIELVLYASLLAVMSVLVVQALISLTRTFGEMKASSALRAGALVGMERMLKEIRFASSVDYAGSMFDSSPGRLTLNSTDEGGAAKTVEFRVATSTLLLIDDGVDKGALTGDAVSVASLVFREATTPKGSLIKIEMTLEDTRLSNPRPATVYGSAVMRGAY
ncbi:MAG: hypothetical protein Q8Q36_01795 [bacterium]|nr:hypothetical protein [bacterium]